MGSKEPRGLAIAGTVISFIDLILLIVVVGGIAAALLFIPIPLLAWFSVPCALVGFIFAFLLWTRAQHDGELPTTFTTVGIVLCSFVMVHFFADAMSASGDALGDLMSGLGSFLGSGGSSLF